MKTPFIQRYFHLILSLLIPFLMSFSYKFVQNQWTTIHVDAFIEITYSKDDCNMPEDGLFHEYVYINIKNLTKNKIEVSYLQQLWYNERCINCDNSSLENFYSIVLEPGDEITGSCRENPSRAVRIFSRMLDGHSNTLLTEFKLTDLSVNPL